MISVISLVPVIVMAQSLVMPN